MWKHNHKLIINRNKRVRILFHIIQSTEDAPCSQPNASTGKTKTKTKNKTKSTNQSRHPAPNMRFIANQLVSIIAICCENNIMSDCQTDDDVDRTIVSLFFFFFVFVDGVFFFVSSLLVAVLAHYRHRRYRVHCELSIVIRC